MTVLLWCSHAFAQKNALIVSAVGDLNPASVVYLTAVKPPEPMFSWNKSALGASVEYRRWIKPHVGVGGFMEGNPSDGKLLPADGSGKYYIWPIANLQMGAMLTERVDAGKWSLWVQEGGGDVVTESLVTNSGWSHDPALVIGGGVDYPLGARCSLTAGERILTTETGCYNGRDCKQSLGTIQEPEIGLVLKW